MMLSGAPALQTPAPPPGARGDCSRKLGPGPVTATCPAPRAPPALDERGMESTGRRTRGGRGSCPWREVERNPGALSRGQLAVRVPDTGPAALRAGHRAMVSEYWGRAGRLLGAGTQTAGPLSGQLSDSGGQRGSPPWPCGGPSSVPLPPEPLQFTGCRHVSRADVPGTSLQKGPWSQRGVSWKFSPVLCCENFFWNQYFLF